MTSTFQMSNTDLQYLNCAGQRFRCFLGFLNPVAITTNWVDLSLDNKGNWLPPQNVDTCATRTFPYAPTANMGGNRIGFVGEPLYFDGTRSCQRYDLPVSSYGWAVSGSGATVTHYANGAQVGVSWSAPGLYTISLTVSDRYGGTTTGTRQVLIYQDRASTMPGVLSLSGLSGSLASNGWQCQITTVNAQTTILLPDALPPGTYLPVVVRIETEYEVVPGYWVSRTIGPNGQFNPGYPYQDPTMFFDGYVQSGSVHTDPDKDTLSFTCSTVQMLLNEAQCHMIGYYNATVKTYVNNVPTVLNTSPTGVGYLVAGLQTPDVLHALLQTHSNIGKFHDVEIYITNIPTAIYAPGSAQAWYSPIYTTLGTTEGSLLQNIQDLTGNEWSALWCEHDGSIRVGPQVNFRGSDYWKTALLGQTVASLFLNLAQDLGYSFGSDLSQLGNTFPILPSMPMPLTLVHPYGHAQPNYWGAPFQSQQSNTVPPSPPGPPILCIFSDVPIYDTGDLPQQPLYPWITNNWPQDLAVYPLSFDFPENYTGRAALVKLDGTLAGQNTVWPAWYPQSAFTVIPAGTSENVVTTLPSGSWQVDDSKILPDVTTNLNKQLVLNWWWEIARRVYYANNVNYGATITLGMFTACSLNDIVAVTRQNGTLGPVWNTHYFFVNQIDYDLDFTARTWSTVITCTEVTSILLGPITPPPKVIPKV